MADRRPADKAERSIQSVLVVDDDQSNLSSLCALLVSLGYQILKATAVRQALATATTLVPSLVIISLDLPGMDGFKLMRQLRNNPAAANIPFIGFIRQDDVDLRNRSFGHGAAGYFSLPIDAEDLFRTAQSALEKNPRSSMRVRTLLPVKVYDNAHDCLFGAYALALSTGGMFLRTMSPVSVDSEISLEFDLNGQTVSAETRVIYNCQGGCGPDRETGIGLRFVEIDPRDQDNIRRFIKSEVLKGLAGATA